MIEVIKALSVLLWVGTTIVGVVTIMKLCARATAPTENHNSGVDLEEQLAAILRADAAKILRNLQPEIISYSREQLVEFGRLLLVFGLVDAGVGVLFEVPEHLAAARDRAGAGDERTREVFDELYRVLSDVLVAARPAA